MSYYFISIGGSGAKVMESLAHLCVLGALPNTRKQKDIYIMAIDPDRSNGNLTRTGKLLNSCCTLQKLNVGSDTDLFKTEINQADPFIWSPSEINSNLDNILDYQVDQGKPIGDLYEALYKKDERRTNLNKGFRGHPSIGAAVMAKKVSLGDTGEEPWKTFISTVNADVDNGKDVHIFIAGSIFGGTGAAGLPTIARLLRNQFNDASKVAIGGAFILPYFSFKSQVQEDGSIFADSENFITNTKAAVKYYSVQKNTYNTMYFIGDNGKSNVEFSIGAIEQKNDANVVDFYGALAAIDFYSMDIANMKPCAYISRCEEESYSWDDLPELQMDNGDSVELRDKMAQFTRFVFAYEHLIRPVIHKLSKGELPLYEYPWYVEQLANVNLETAEVRAFEEYTESYVRWLAQIENRSDGRKVTYVDKDSFAAEKEIKISPSLFANCVDNTSIDINEIWFRLSEGECDDNKHYKRKEYSGISGFSKFLRLLYDSCESTR